MVAALEGEEGLGEAVVPVGIERQRRTIGWAEPSAGTRLFDSFFDSDY